LKFEKLLSPGLWKYFPGSTMLAALAGLDSTKTPAKKEKP
jgi:hypothetical protein